MSFKEYIKNELTSFFIITTCVNIVMFVLGSIYNKGVMFSYEILLYPPLYGLFATIPSIILYSRKELTMRQFMIRKILHFVCLEVLLVLITFSGENLCRENADIIVSFVISVFIVTLCVNLVSWVLDKRQAKLLMQELVDYQAGKM